MVGWDFSPANLAGKIPASFQSRATLLTFTESSPTEGLGEWSVIELRAIAAPEEGTIYILEENYVGLDLYRAIPRDLPPSEAAVWARDFIAALAAVPSPDMEDPLKRLLTVRSYTHTDTPLEYRLFSRPEYIAFLRATSFADTSQTRPTMAGPPAPAERQPGARQRITFPVLEANGLTHWQADLVFQDGHWQAVTVRF